MGIMKKTYDEHFKAKVALVAIKGEETISQIASKYNVHPLQDQSMVKTGTGKITSYIFRKRQWT